MDDGEIKRPQHEHEDRVGETGGDGAGEHEPDPRDDAQHGVGAVDPEEGGQREEAAPARTEMRGEGVIVKRRRGEAARADERDELVDRGEKGDDVDGAEQPEDDETGEPVRFARMQGRVHGESSHGSTAAPRRPR